MHQWSIRDRSELEAAARLLSGKTAAVVYGFSPERTARRVWYDQWRSNVIFAYGDALEGLAVEPLFVDVASFCRRALAGELAGLTCAFNLNAGITPISHWAMVPAVAEWCGIPPLPASAEVLIVGERKDTAALIARQAGFEVPTCYAAEEIAGLPAGSQLIVKPRDMGGSVGLFRTTSADFASLRLDPNTPMVIQEFIRGQDVTIPVVFQPTTGRHRAPAGVVYHAAAGDPRDWVHDRDTKTTDIGFRKEVIAIPRDIEEQVVRYAKLAELGPYARVDLRVRSFEDGQEGAPSWDAVFLEVNPLPTLCRGVNFHDAIESEIFRAAFHEEADAFASALGGAVSPLALVLGCAMIGLG